MKATRTSAATFSLPGIALAACLVVFLSATAHAAQWRSPERLGAESDLAVWIATADSEGMLAPIARLVGKSREPIAWAAPFEASPLGQESRQTQGADAEGPYPKPDLSVAEFPATWWLYPQAMPEKPQRLQATALRVISAYCLERAVIATDPKAFRAALSQAGGDEDIKTEVSVETVGIAFSQKPDAILSPAQIPQRDEIAAELGFYNRLQFGEGYRRFVWIGFFQIHNIAYGLIHEFGYEGSGIDLIEITNNKGRILARLYEGGC